jgi:hypothetical protein
VRLACLNHAASVRSEPESNSPINYIWMLHTCNKWFELTKTWIITCSKITDIPHFSIDYSIVKEQKVFWSLQKIYNQDNKKSA